MLEIKDVNGNIIKFEDIKPGDIVYIKTETYPEKFMIVDEMISKEELDDFKKKYVDKEIT